MSTGHAEGKQNKLYYKLPRCVCQNRVDHDPARAWTLPESEKGFLPLPPTHTLTGPPQASCLPGRPQETSQPMNFLWHFETPPPPPRGFMRPQQEMKNIFLNQRGSNVFVSDKWPGSRAGRLRHVSPCRQQVLLEMWLRQQNK